MSDKVVFKRSVMFKEGFERHKAKIADKFKEFIKQKSEDPMSRFGAKDQHYQGEGPLGKTDAIHAHLTHDISILYKRSGKNATVISLMAILSHDESGTGQPPNIKIQKKLANKVNDMTFESKLPNGSYPARASGFNTVVTDGGKEIVFKTFDGCAVKGIDIADTVTVKDGKFTSKVLGDMELSK